MQIIQEKFEKNEYYKQTGVNYIMFLELEIIVLK